MMTELLSLDYRLFRFFNGFANQSETFDTFAVFFSEYIIFLLIAGLALFVLLEKNAHERRVTLLEALGAVVLSRGIIVSIIRALFFRPRPFVVMGEVVQLVPHSPLEGSFPSGHATFMFALAFAFLFRKKYAFGMVYFVLALLSSLSRIVVGVHYPADIVAGLVIAFAAACFIRFIFQRYKPRVPERES